MIQTSVDYRLAPALARHICQTTKCSWCFNDAILMYQELDDHVQGLHSMLSFFERAESTSPTYQTVMHNPKRGIDSRIDPNFVIQLLTANDILDNPNLAAAQVFMDGLNEAFEEWILPSSLGGIRDASPAELAVIDEYKTLLESSKAKIIGGSPTQADYEALYALPANFVNAMEAIEGEEAPPKGKVTVFWSDMMLVYNTMAGLANPVKEQLNSEIADYDLKIAQGNWLIETMRNIVTSIKDLVNPLWSMVSTESFGWGNSENNSMQADMAKTEIILAGQFRDLMEHYPEGNQNSMVPELRSQVTSFVQSMSGLQIKPDFKIGGLLGLIYSCLACEYGYGQSSTSLSEQGYKNLLQEEKTYWSIRSPGLTITDVINTFANTPSGSVQGISIFRNGLNNFNPEFFQKCAELLTSNRATLMAKNDYMVVMNAMNTCINNIQGTINGWTAAAEAANAKKSTVEPEALYYYNTMQANKKTFVTSSPIQSTYASLMLDKFLPNQQYILRTLGIEMVFSNKAAKYMNQVITHVARFQSSDVYYSLAIYIRQTNVQAYRDDGVDPAKQIQELLTKEKARCDTDINCCNRAITEINTILAEVEQDGDMSSSQKSELRQALTSYQSQFRHLLRNLSNLKVFLKDMTITRVDNDDSTTIAFKVAVGGIESDKWVNQLAAFESFVIEGGSDGALAGGEQQVLQDLESTHQNYTTFNQNQQLALQLESSAIQQEWTMVAATLALMNQIFAKLIRRYK